MNTDKAKIGLMREGRFNKWLSGKIRYNGAVLYNSEFIEALVNEGREFAEATVPKYEFNRTKYNRLDGWQQAEYEEKLKETKTEYQAKSANGTYIAIDKFGYEYAQMLKTNKVHK